MCLWRLLSACPRDCRDRPAMYNSASVAILAGGGSSRMGTDKSFVKLNGKPLFECVLERVSALGVPIILIANQPDRYAAYKLPTYVDLMPNCGSLGGLYTAIHYSPTASTLCVACDMP